MSLFPRSTYWVRQFLNMITKYAYPCSTESTSKHALTKSLRCANVYICTSICHSSKSNRNSQATQFSVALVSPHFVNQTTGKGAPALGVW